jgi:excisionase family DNA binding protein
VAGVPPFAPVFEGSRWHPTCVSPAVPDESEGEAGRGRSFLIEDAARVMGVSRRTIYYRIREGRLRTIGTRCGSQRVLLSSIDALRRANGNGGEREDRQEESDRPEE